MSIKVTPEDIAAEIQNAMRSYLTIAELVVVDTRNKTRNYSIDHAHDFCDANEAILDACEALNIDLMYALEHEGEDAQAANTMALINAAHDIVIEQGYAPPLRYRLSACELYECADLLFREYEEDRYDSRKDGQISEEAFTLYATLWLLSVAHGYWGSAAEAERLVALAQSGSPDDLSVAMYG